MATLRPVPGHEAEFNAALDEWEAFAATKRGLPEWNRFPFMTTQPRAVVPKTSTPAEPKRASVYAPAVDGPAVFAPKSNSKEDVSAAIQEVYTPFAPGGVASKRLAELELDNSPYIRMIRKRFDLAVAKAFGSKHVGIQLKLKQAEWAKNDLQGEELEFAQAQFKVDMQTWHTKHTENIATLTAEYEKLKNENTDDGIDDGVDIDTLAASIARGKFEKT